mmetsp:Transcript_37245/g.87907  ORF Transcript_37245/g.87907 Transcript_37245/m.87907 type:complete len:224 (-) Transcript_37245:443-1114(-)
MDLSLLHGTEERRGVPEALGLDPHPHALDQLPNHRDLPALCRVVEHSVAGPRRHVQLRAQRQQRLQHRFVPLHRSVVHPVQFRRVPVVHVGVGTLQDQLAGLVGVPLLDRLQQRRVQWPVGLLLNSQRVAFPLPLLPRCRFHVAVICAVVAKGLVHKVVGQDAGSDAVNRVRSVRVSPASLVRILERVVVGLVGGGPEGVGRHARQHRFIRRNVRHQILVLQQ